jgi:hypothetical protein
VSLGCLGGIFKNPLRVPYWVNWMQTQTQTPNQTQTPEKGQIRKLIRKVVRGKIMEIKPLGNGEYMVWSRYEQCNEDDGGTWDIYTRVKIQGNNVEVLDEDWE